MDCDRKTAFSFYSIGTGKTDFCVAYSTFKQKLISFVFQPVCCLCNEVLQPDLEYEVNDTQQLTSICGSCYHNTVNTDFDRCYFCGTETSPLNPFGSRCSICRSWNSRFERAIAIGKYRDQLKSAILDIKRESNETKAFQVGQLLGQLSEKFDLPKNIDGVVAVPSHWRRRFSRRGLHVSDVMAEGFCASTGLKKIGNAIKCARYTKKQSKLRPSLRTRNVRNAFRINSRIDLTERTILLFDDVMTSGATVNECTKILLNAGVSEVFVAVAARGTGVS